MEVLDNIMFKLSVHTKEIRSEDLQKVMLVVKKTNNFNEQFEEYCDEMLVKLWHHLSFGLLEFDDQLLCCTSFYSVLTNSKRQGMYLNKALEIISHEILLKNVENDETNDSSLAVSLCYGMFQSSYLTQQNEKPIEELTKILQATFQLLQIMAYEYSQHTFIVFKIITAFKKVIGTPFQELLFSSENTIKLLNLINHNWENPITGVRNLNRIIFQILLQIVDNDMYKRILNEINGFYWNKAKFLMLTEIIEYTHNTIEDLILINNWIDGLINNLYNTGLVSAGADMYYAILKKLNSQNIWEKLFLSYVIEILRGSSFKAIENFSNYWCLATFKKFPILAQILINELQKFDDSEPKLYSCILVTKQANKLGLIKKNWLVSSFNDEEKLVLRCLEHCNASIRMSAFEIMCVSQRKCLPSNIEFQQVLNFLQNNVNSDCTVLRLHILNNLANFLTTLHISFLNNTKYDKEDLYNLENFCKNLQMFIIVSLNLNGNYQRKITTLKITYLILKHFNEVSTKKVKQSKDTNQSLIGYLKENCHWLLNSSDYIMKLISLLKDPATDVHDCILQLLLEFYLPDISDTNIIKHLVEDSLTCIKSKFFFEITCGLNIFKLIINIILNNQIVEAKFKNIEDIFCFAYDEINAVYYSKMDVVESIATGRQLHSFLSILYIIFDVTSKNSYQMVLSDGTVMSLLSILKDVSNQFASEDDISTSSDFSKINDMVHTLIKSSSFNDSKNDQTDISGLYQIVLNCLWLNVKASCDLASILIQYYKENYTVCEECLNIIAHVLETSRHKGAIEAAGAGLGRGIRYITSSGIESEVSKLPLSLLKRKLNELLLETSKMSSVTRRGAGLSIMVHRIVSNDVQKGKPLFHYFMKKILIACKTSQITCDRYQEVNDEKDLPKAIYIHFLTRIVIDSSLASDMMYYSAELAELAFHNLTNPVWQIRNAALQLYGALIPKLIGQKKPSGADDEILSAVACDEFRTHSTKLWTYIACQIKQDHYQDIIQEHSNLVPVLNTLANIAQRYNFSYNFNECESDINLLPYIFALLGSPIYTVRRLASKCIVNLYSFEMVFNTIKKVKITSENYLHGILMVIEHCYKAYSDVKQNKQLLDSIRNEYCTFLMKGNHSYLCKWSMDKLFTAKSSEVTIDEIKNIMHIEKVRRHEPGVSLWVNQKIQRYLESITWTVLPEILKLLMDSCEFEKFCEIIAERIKISNNIPEKVLLDIGMILLNADLQTQSCMLWKTLYFISLRTHINMQISTCFLQDQLNYVSYNMRYTIPFAARVFAEQADNVYLLQLSRTLYILCNPENNDIDMRSIAAMANNELAYKFTNFSDDIKINAIKSAVILLQDEDEDIRNLSVTFYKSIVNEMDRKHPFICLNEMLKKNFLYAHLSDPVLCIHNICNDLFNFIDSIRISKGNTLNPFSNDSKNIYLEVDVLKQLLIDLNKTFE